MATMEHSFGSDNHSGVHPLVMKAIVEESNGFRASYGADDYTLSVLEKLEKLLGGNCKALFVLNGTGANAVALAPFAHLRGKVSVEIVRELLLSKRVESNAVFATMPQSLSKRLHREYYAKRI